MKPKTTRNLLLLCILLDLALIGVIVWDYFRNDSDYIVITLAVFALFLIITFILFLIARPVPGERVVVKQVIHQKDPDHLELTQVHVHEHHHPARPLSPIQPPIPPAPANTTLVARAAPPRPVALESRGRPVNPVRKIGKRPRRRAGGPFRYKGYTLHTKVVKVNGGGTRNLYFFAKKRPKSGKPSRKPRGYHVGVNNRTGLPFLVKGKGRDGESHTPAKRKPGYKSQCQALTDDGKQCRNSARGTSKYCAPHKGYQPPTTKGLAKRIEGKRWSATDKRTDRSSVRGADTRAAVRRAPDTVVSVRRRRRSARGKARRKAR